MYDHFKRYSFMLFILFTLLISAESFADKSTFNAIFLKPAPGPDSYLMLRDTNTLHQFQFSVAETVFYAYHPLDLRSGSSRLRGVIDHLVVADTRAAFGIMEWAQFGVNIPFVVVDQFESPDATASGLKNKMHLSDIMIEFKLKPLDKCKQPLGLAIIPFMTIPTGKDAYYIGDPGITGGINLSTDVQLTRISKFTFSAGYKTGKKIKFRNVEYQHQLLLGTGVALEVRDFTFFGEFDMSTGFEHFFSSKASTPAEVFGGMKWKIFQSGFHLGGSLGTCIVCGVKGSAFQAAIDFGYTYQKSKFKTESRHEQIMCINKFAKSYELEEILSLKSKCPPDPAQYVKGLHDESCPKLYELQSVADLVNVCPTNPNEFVASIHDQSCNKVYTLTNSFDKEEIMAIYELSNAEMSLRCPADPKDYNPYLFDAACPKYYTLQDTIALAKDCPANPKDYKKSLHSPDCLKFYELEQTYTPTEWTFITTTAKKDTDGDGINDSIDRCPQYPEDRNGFADEDGCPEGGVVAITGGEIKTFEPVTFSFNSYKLDYNSQQMLDQIIGLINKTPWITLVRVGGHADDIGTYGSKRTYFAETRKRCYPIYAFTRASHKR